MTVTPRPRGCLAVALALGAAMAPAWASYAQMNLCRDFWPCVAMATLFFAGFGVPLAAALGLFIRLRAHPGAPLGRAVVMAVLIGGLAYLAAIFAVTLVNHLLPLPGGGAGLAISAVLFLVLLVAIVVPASRRLR